MDCCHFHLTKGERKVQRGRHYLARRGSAPEPTRCTARAGEVCTLWPGGALALTCGTAYLKLSPEFPPVGGVVSSASSVLLTLLPKYLSRHLEVQASA